MTDTAIALVAAILGSGGLGAGITAWITNRGGPENRLIDQLQEMVDDLRKTNADAQRREAVLMNYAWECQRHINDGKPPPPPRWPNDLITR